MNSIAVQEIHDTLATRRNTDWHAMWEQRGVRLLYLAGLLEQQVAENETLQTELELVKGQRMIMAVRCADQARMIQSLLAKIPANKPKAAEADAHPLADAIAVMQRSGIR
jgi:hypothetical protein